jgi:hypothetical protein
LAAVHLFIWVEISNRVDFEETPPAAAAAAEQTASVLGET